jgi:aminopeptidase N
LHVDQARGRAELHLAQADPAAGADAPPLPIPLDILLLDSKGQPRFGPVLHLLIEAEETLIIPGIPGIPGHDGPAIASVNRGLSAPVRVEPDPGINALGLLARHESDPVARRRAIEGLARAAVMARLGAGSGDAGHPLEEALALLLDTPCADPELLAALLALPAPGRLAGTMRPVDPGAAAAARAGLAADLSARLSARWWRCWRQAGDAPPGRGIRALGNVALAWMLAGTDPEAEVAARHQFETAGHMTARLGALTALVHGRPGAGEDLLTTFRLRHRLPESLDHWFALQAAAPHSETVEAVERLRLDADYDRRHPSRVQALFRTLALNEVALFRPDGAGLRLLLDEVLVLDRINPAQAAGLLRPLAGWRRLRPDIGRQVEAALNELLREAGLSPGAREMAETMLE